MLHPQRKQAIFKQSAAPTLATLAGVANGWACWDNLKLVYRMRTIDYKPRIFQEFPCLAHKLSVILATFECKPHWGKKYTSRGL